jgi:hypothetical protein
MKYIYLSIRYALPNQPVTGLFKIIIDINLLLFEAYETNDRLFICFSLYEDLPKNGSFTKAIMERLTQILGPNYILQLHNPPFEWDSIHLPTGRVWLRRSSYQQWVLKEHLALPHSVTNPIAGDRSWVNEEWGSPFFLGNLEPKYHLHCFN